ncbi:MAG: type I methionyl aminopeptidase [Spirochaetaceae bacterium]
MIKLKTADEINRIRDASKLLAETHMELEKMVQPGIRTEELDRFAADYIRKKGGEPAFLNYMGYPASLCVSINEEVIHGIPGKRTLKEGDVVSMDLGVELAGYYSDMARTVVAGNVDESVQRLVDVTKECLYRGIDQVKLKKRIHDISHAVYSHAHAHGYGVVREYCGHGVGYSQHEDPQIPNYVSRGANPRLKKGMVLAIEPMINAGGAGVTLLEDNWTVVTEDGSISAHWEHTVVVFEDHAEILTEL